MPIPPRTAAIEDPPAARGGAVSAVAGAPPSTVLAAAPGHEFLYVVYPDDPGNWRIATVDGEPVWLPLLQKQILIPGCGGVRTLQAGEPPELAYEEALNKIKARGGVHLPRNLDYCYGTPCRDPRTRRSGHVWHDQFETPIPPKGRNRRTIKYDTDTEARDAWVLALIQEGHLPAPSPEVIDHNRLRLERRIYERAQRRGVELPTNLPNTEEAVETKALPKIVTDAMAAVDEAAEAAVPQEPAPAAPPKPRKPARAKSAATGVPRRVKTSTKSKATPPAEEASSDG